MNWHELQEPGVLASEDGRWTIVRTPPPGRVREGERPVMQLWRRAQPVADLVATVRLGPTTSIAAVREVLQRLAEGYDGA